MEKVARALARKEAGEKIVEVDWEDELPTPDLEPSLPFEPRRNGKRDHGHFHLDIVFAVDIDGEEFHMKTWTIGKTQEAAIQQFKESKLGRNRIVSAVFTAGMGPKVSQERTMCGTRIPRMRQFAPRSAFFLHQGRRSKYF